MKVTFYYVPTSPRLYVELLEGVRKVSIPLDLQLMQVQRFLAGQDHYLFLASDTILYRFGSRNISQNSLEKRFTILSGPADNQTVLKVPEKNVFKFLTDFICLRGYGCHQVMAGTDSRTIVAV